MPTMQGHHSGVCMCIVGHPFAPSLKTDMEMKAKRLNLKAPMTVSDYEQLVVMLNHQSANIARQVTMAANQKQWRTQGMRKAVEKSLETASNHAFRSYFVTIGNNKPGKRVKQKRLNVVICWARMQSSLYDSEENQRIARMETHRLALEGTSC